MINPFQLGKLSAYRIDIPEPMKTIGYVFFSTNSSRIDKTITPNNKVFSYHYSKINIAIVSTQSRITLLIPYIYVQYIKQFIGLCF